MRLIDADSMLVNMDKGIQGTAREYLKFYQMAVNDEPTAYDLDKVVELLERDSQNIELIYPTDQGYDYEDGVGIDVNKAKEIVKSGGIQHPDSSNADTENVAANWKEHLAGRFNRFE